MPFITLVACGYQRKKGIVLIPLSVIPLGSERLSFSPVYQCDMICIYKNGITFNNTSYMVFCPFVLPLKVIPI